MKLLLVTLLVAMATAAPQQEYDGGFTSPQSPSAASDGQAKIISQDSFVGPDGYHFSYETSDGTSRQEQGSLKDVNPELPSLSVTGRYTYIAPDGQTIEVSYLADENGFQPVQRAGPNAQTGLLSAQDNSLDNNEGQSDQYNTQK